MGGVEELRGVDLYLLTGPTAVGKTELSLRWAETHGAEIVSCDSLLFYRGMDIGTAKPSAEERARVRHHLIDVAEPDEPWSIDRYLAEAAAAVAEIHRRGKKVLVTGGSGFYLKSFFAPVVDSVVVPAEVAREADELEREGLEAMVARLLEVDPGAGEVLELQNPRRVKRALERCLASGKTVGELRRDMAEREFPFSGCRTQICLLTREREELRERVAARVDGMLAAGLVEEVRGLLARGLERNPSAASAIGYRETIRFLAGGVSEGELREEIVRNTQRLVKKQMTWFRHQLPVEMVNTVNLSAGGGAVAFGSTGSTSSTTNGHE